MSDRLAKQFIRSSVIYALLGMALGILMAASKDHSQMPTHAHLMLFGWVGMTLYAAVYKLWPMAASGRLPFVHAVVAHIALIGLVLGLYLIYGGHSEAGEPIASIASTILTANMALFAWIVWKGTR
jgi:cbb3-type cytochrome oxidase subunit 1